ncbi:type IX secretion system membrane protein PorP/SprF [Odoribacter sp. Z80]|nr:type IX secretion system membrane protein PorP/SprF [Odoribacter sp. Z80]
MISESGLAECFMKIKKNIIILIGCWIWGGVLLAQDTKVTHPFMWKSFNNPAYTGFNGLAGVSVGMQRAYWSNPLDFRSYFVAADYAFQEKRTFGLGGVSLFYQRDQEGSLMYVTNTFSAAVSARAKVARSTVLQVGIQPSLYNKSVDPSRITLGDQFDPFYGQILDVSPELINFYADRVTMFDIGAGIYGETDFNIAWHGVASLEYGFSVYHIIESTQSFLSEHGSKSSEKNLLNRRYSGYLSYSHPLIFGNQWNTILSPYLMMDVQSVMRNLQFGVYWEEERFGMIGLGLRSDQYEGLQVGTLLLHLGANIMANNDSGWKVGYTFEMPTHQGTMYKNTSHSLSLHWYFKITPKRCVLRFEHSPNNTKRVKSMRSTRKRAFKF